MSGDKPKLNLRSQQPVEDTSSYDDEVEALLAGFSNNVEPKTSQPQRTTTSRPSALRPQQSATTTSMDNTLKARGKKPDADISEVWDDLKQRQINEGESMFSNPEIGEIVEKIGANVAGFTKRLKTGYKKAKSTPAAVQSTQRKYRSKIVNTTNTKSIMVANRPKSVPRSPNNSTESSRFSFVRRKPVLTAGAVILVIVISAWGLQGSGSKEDPTDVNGASTAGVKGLDEADLTSGNTPVAVVGRETEFDLLFPPTLSKDDTGIALVSPPDSVPVYAFNDSLEDAVMSVSEQQVPETFKQNIEKSLKDLADSFAATDVITTENKIKIYHGYSDKNDGVQSLMFIKSNLLIFISSTEKLSDNSWSDYADSFN